MSAPSDRLPGRYIVRTLGCKANLADSQLIESELRRRGWTAGAPQGAGIGEKGGELDLCIVNSCTVTDEADRQSRRLAARLARENPGAAVVVTGCAAEVDPERLARSKGIHYVIGNRDKPELVETVMARLASGGPHGGPGEVKDGKVEFANGEVGRGELLGDARGYAEIISRHPHDREWPAIDEGFLLPPAEARDPERRRTRAFLKIQEGCNAFCTYCVIPYGRGPSRSPRPRELLQHIRHLVEGGAREVILTGTNIGDYGTDWGVGGESTGRGDYLTDLVDMILSETPLERLRLSSLDPTEITPRLLKLMEKEQPRLCPHFHVSLQSPHDRILRLMKRKYGSLEVRSCLEAIATIRTSAPGGVFVGMDVITGFPGEGEAEFEESRHALEALPWSRLHVFPYSERQGTPATRLPGIVPPAERARRARELGALSLIRLQSFGERALTEARRGKLAGNLHGVLLEKPGAAPAVLRSEKLGKPSRWVTGYTPNYLPIAIPASAEEKGNRVVEITPERLLVDSAAAGVWIIGQALSR